MSILTYYYVPENKYLKINILILIKIEAYELANIKNKTKKCV